ncbi:hypothetical protein E3J61_02395 [Candidatus Dependentiae bacterium]|nr:MAG: hypothetical protein E3J61_02395 [Candidatus Dependentiae bacterium]
MKWIKIYLLCSFIVPLSALACQPCGKLRGKVARRLSKQCRKLGPNVYQRSKQGEWERLLAQRDSTKGNGAAIGSSHIQPPVLDIQDVAIGPRYVKGRSIRQTTLSRSYKTVLLLTMLLAAECNALQPIRYQCVDIERHIEDRRYVFDRARKLAEENKEAFGVITFPATPTLNCPPLSIPRYHWTADHAYEAAQKGLQFLDAFNQKAQQLNRAIFLHNNHVERCTGKVAKVYNYMDGKFPDLKQKYIDSFAALNRDEKSFCARPDDELNNDPLIKVGNMIGDYVEKVNTVDETTFGDRNPPFLALMKANDRYVALAKRIIHELANGSYGFNLKKYAASVDVESASSVPFLADVLDYSIYLAQVGRGTDAIHMQARLDEVQLGFLVHGLSDKTIVPCKDGEHEDSCGSFKPKILCSKEGLCGISDAIAAQLGGAKVDFVATDALLKDIRHPIDSAQDILTIFTDRGEYVGQPHLGDGPIDANIRVVDSGHQEASRLFEFCASGHKIKEHYNSKIGASIYQLSLDDGTRVTYQQADNSGDDATIIIENMPAWISSDRLEFRFPQ